MRKLKLFVGLAAMALVLAGCGDSEEKKPESSTSNPTTSSVTPVNQYDITWVVNGSETSVKVNEGVTPVYDGTPTKASDAQYTYAFSGWQPSVVPATANATYVAQFAPTTRSYNVQFLDEDETTVLKEGLVEYGQLPVAPADPTKAQTESLVYEFSGWDHDLEEVHGAQTYVATYSSSARKYDISWVDGDGKTIKVDKVAWHDTPVYSGEAPTKTKTEDLVYTWDGGWEEEIVQVEGNATYHATFDDAPRPYYTVSIINPSLTAIYNNTKCDPGQILDFSGVDFSYDDDPDDHIFYEFVGFSDEVVPVTAHRNYIAVYLQLEFITDHYTVMGLTCSDLAADLVIPDEYKGYDVTQIRTLAFSNADIKSITLGSNISYIGERAFEGVHVPSIEIPASVTVIDEDAFKNATDLKEITFNEGLVQVRRHAFINTGISELELPESLTIVGYQAFAWNKYLYRVVMNETDFSDFNSEYYNGVFDDCGMITEVLMPNVTSSNSYQFGYEYYPLVKLTSENVTNVGTFTYGELDEENHIVANVYYTPNGETSPYLVGCLKDEMDYRILEATGAPKIKKYAFMGNTTYGDHELDEIHICEDVTTVQGRAFQDSFNTTQLVIEECESKLEVEGNCFDGLKEITSLDLSKRPMGYLASYSFANCYKLTSVTLSSETTGLGDYCFAWSKLTSLHVTAKVSSVGGDAFRGVNTIEEFTVDSGSTYFKAIDGVLFTYNEKELVSFPGAKTCTDNTYVVPSGTQVIRLCAFQNVKSVERVDLPASLTDLREFAFLNSIKVTTITYPGTVAEFEALTLNYRWASSCGFTYVTCDGGTSTKGIQ